jgi:hypothetical protein
VVLMRTLTEHRVNPANDKLTITVADEPGSGGASHRYVITGFNPETNPSLGVAGPAGHHAEVLFQNGPIGEVGVNGVTHEALLAILIDRLRSFQSGPYSSRENALALTKLEEAKLWLHSRTLSRMARGVEGTHAV